MPPPLPCVPLVPTVLLTTVTLYNSVVPPAKIPPPLGPAVAADGAVDQRHVPPLWMAPPLSPTLSEKVVLRMMVVVAFCVYRPPPNCCRSGWRGWSTGACDHVWSSFRRAYRIGRTTDSGSAAVPANRIAPPAAVEPPPVMARRDR